MVVPLVVGDEVEVGLWRFSICDRHRASWMHGCLGLFPLPFSTRRLMTIPFPALHLRPLFRRWWWSMGWTNVLAFGIMALHGRTDASG